MGMRVRPWPESRAKTWVATKGPREGQGTAQRVSEQPQRCKPPVNTGGRRASEQAARDGRPTFARTSKTSTSHAWEGIVNHMPYEENEIGVPRRENDEAPGRTPQQAEGGDGAERRVPAGEPSKTPGSAEGEGGDEREMSGGPTY